MGVPQGCALSAYLCNILVTSWSERVAATGAIPEAYLDDRTMYAATARQLEEAWNESTSWDLEHKWSLNRANTIVACAPKRATIALTHCDGTPVVEKKAVKILGHQVGFTYCQVNDLQKQRLTKALTSCERLEVMRVGTAAAQRVVATVIMKQFVYGLQATPVPVRQCRQLRAAIKRATGTFARRQAWPVLAAFFQTPDNVDPQAAAIYVHLVNVLRAIRASQESWQWWQALRDLPATSRPQGPRGVTDFYLRKLGVAQRGDGCEWSAHGERVDIRNAEWGKLKHCIRLWLRKWLLCQAELIHPHLRGLLRRT